MPPGSYGRLALQTKPGSDYGVLAWLVRELLIEGADWDYLNKHAQQVDAGDRGARQAARDLLREQPEDEAAGGRGGHRRDGLQGQHQPLAVAGARPLPRAAQLSSTAMSATVS